MRRLIIGSLIIAAANYAASFDGTLNDAWESFKYVFQKSYSSAEEIRRRSIFQERVESIARHNLKADLGISTFTRGLNKYSDLSHQEYIKFLNGYNARIDFRGLKPSTWLPLENVCVPDHVDWRDAGLVTSVKDQGMCGSFWAFSSTGSLEAQHKKRTGNLVSLSEQNLVDCVRDNHGCEGGWMDSAFEYIVKQKGIDTEVSYPYVGLQDSCFFNDLTIGANCTGFVDLPQGNETVLMEAVATIGPVSVAIDAEDENFLTYKSGIYDNPYCLSDVEYLTHAVLVVGYGSENGNDYWLVKNSWGTSYGMDGYVKMSRNKGNQCGIATKASYPLV